MASKIEDIIDEIEAFVDECKPTAFSSNKIIVNKDDLESLLQELRTKTPDEIRKYQRMIANREQILADAKAKADEIINAAQIQTNALVSEHEIMQQAYARANEVIQISQKKAQETLDRATMDANQIRMGAIAYTDELLAGIQTVLGNSIETARSRNENFIYTMQSYLDTVEANRSALVADSVSSAPQDATGHMQEPNLSAVPTSEEQYILANENDVTATLDIPESFFNKE
ncbi:MAG: ATPase [Pseudobutyrivibrio sp.]|nr:ATPase [Pseudobutyrivibrio sp.]